MKVGVKAFDNQDDAAADWAPGGFAATKGDNFERAAQIFQTKAFGDQKVPYLYVVGSMVIGHKSTERGVSQETDPSGSTMTLNGKDITKYQSTRTVTTRSGNVILSQKEVTYQNWRVSAMVHTHNAGIDYYSIKDGDILNGQTTYGGDYGIATTGISVYMIPSTSNTSYRMFRLDLSPNDQNRYFNNKEEGQKYMNQKKQTIYINGGNIESIYSNGKQYDKKCTYNYLLLVKH